MIVLIVLSCIDKNDYYHIGVAIPLTNNGSEFFIDIKKGIELAVDELNKNGGIRGRKIRLIYGDTQLNPNLAKQVGENMVSIHNVSIVIGPMTSAGVIASARIADENNIILITPCATSNDISGISPNVFRLTAPDIIDTKYIYNFLIEEGIGNLSIAYTDESPYRQEVSDLMMVMKNKILVKDFEVIIKDTTSIVTLVKKLFSSEPEAIYLTGSPMDIGLLIKVLFEYSSDIQIISNYIMENLELSQIAGNYTEGIIYFTRNITAKNATIQEKIFINNFTRKYGHQPGYGAANAYDAVNIIYYLLNEVGFDSGKILSQFPKIKKYNGASGLFDINSFGESNQKPKIMTIINSETLPYQRNNS